MVRESLCRFSYIGIHDLIFGTTLFVIAAFYYWLNWSPSLPILDGDHATYL